MPMTLWARAPNILCLKHLFPKFLGGKKIKTQFSCKVCQFGITARPILFMLTNHLFHSPEFIEMFGDILQRPHTKWKIWFIILVNDLSCIT